MQEKKDVKIMIPQGCFEGNCYSCFLAKVKDKDAEGRVLCKGAPGGYNFPDDRNGCKYYLSRTKQWVKIIALLWFVGAILEVLISVFSR